MYPGPDDPDLGVFVQAVEHELERRGHELERAVVDHRSGGKARYLRLGRDALTTARRFRPDVVYAHFLLPTGLLAALASRAPLVVTAHGRDVRNIGAYPGVRMATRWVVRRAAAVVAVSDYLRRELETKVSEARGKTEVVDCGVDLERFSVRPAPGGPTAYLCVGSLIEPFGLALLEAMAAGRSVVATRVGGPPEFVPPEAGALVDPTDVDDIARGLRAAAALPCPNEAARRAAEEHDVRRQADRIQAILERAARGRQAGARRAA